MAKDKLTSLRRAAELLGFLELASEGKLKDPERTVRAMVRRGELEGRRVGRFFQVTERSIDRILQGKA